MAKKRINVYTNMEDKIENTVIDAIIDNKVIKYLDSDHNKIIVDCKNNILIKENNEYIIKINFFKNIVSVLLKDYNREFFKEIKTLTINSDNNIYYVKYKLIDENLINEYKIKF